MKRHNLNSELFISNRVEFIKRMTPNSMAVFYANDEMPKNADATYDYVPNSDLFYLCGIDQEGTRLIIFPNCPFSKGKVLLFLRRTNETISIWEGYKYTQEHAAEISGIAKENIYWNDEFSNVLKKCMYNAEEIYLNTNEHERSAIENEYADIRHARDLRHQYPLHQFKRAAIILRELRSIKSVYEIAAVTEACRITGDAFMRVLKYIRPGVLEYQIEAEIIHEFISQKAQGHAYSPIIASGANACILHYLDNDKECKDGDLILMDFGCRKNNYCADLTRTVPINGKFTERQKILYNIVLDAYRFAIQELIPGTTLDDNRKKVSEFMHARLLEINFYSTEELSKDSTENPIIQKYFMHGVSHHLGIDVHDFGLMHSPIQAGMLFTIEPGLYIPDEKIGIRIETNVVVQEKGNPIDLMAHLPVTIEEIEAAMN